MKTRIIIFLLGAALSINATEQSLVQTIKGRITDKDTKTPLIGATVIVADLSPIKGTVSDLDGYFYLERIPIGRHIIQISYVGYKPYVLEGIYLSSGKELNLNIELTESTTEIDAAVIKANGNRAQPLNEMATLSARSFSVEETGRYAASAFDPARMVQCFAGVTNAGDDIRNEIIIRGNSPRGILWRLEGIEIPNPNHFGDFGSSGGAISMLSSSTLAQSDFYTGAFPAEYGNALAGVFDIRLRNGNQEKREYSFMVGILGIEASAEGYIKSGSKSSYLFNYRYSTLDVLSLFYQPLGDIMPAYQDVSFKVYMPTKKYGVFSIFGLGGYNYVDEPAIADTLKWENKWDGTSYYGSQLVGITGISNLFHINNNTYIKTIISASQNNYTDKQYELIPENDYEKDMFDHTVFENTSFRLSTNLTHKLNSKNTFRAGITGTYESFNLDYEYRELDSTKWYNMLNSSGDYQLYQSYFQWKHYFNNNIQLNFGLHYSYLQLNKTSSLEPRLGLKWNFNTKNIISGAVGLHSMPENITTYYIEKKQFNEGKTFPNKNLEFLKAFHAVVGFEHYFSPNLRIKIETYYQELYDIPVENKDSSIFSVLNVKDVWGVIYRDSLINKGTGRNIGIDLTLEKSFSSNYYFLFSGTIYDSKYTAFENIEYNTRYNGNYSAKLIGGKEFKLGRKHNHTFGINSKILYAGGIRYSPPDFKKSLQKKEVVFQYGKEYSKKVSNYFRLDLGISFKINKEKLTHTIMIDAQNVTNRLNEYNHYYYYDDKTDEVKRDVWYQTGLFPIFNYRIEF